MEKLQLPPRCAICGTIEQLLRCAKCKTIYYCSAAHQHIDWPTHKLECRLLAKQKSNNKIQQLQQAVAAATLNNSSSLLATTPSTTAPDPAAAAAASGASTGLYFTSNGYSGSDVLAGNAATAFVESADDLLLTAVSPLSVILGTNENEIMNSKAEIVSPHMNSDYYGNTVANSTTTMEQMQFRGSVIDADDALLGDAQQRLLADEQGFAEQNNYQHHHRHGQPQQQHYQQQQQKQQQQPQQQNQQFPLISNHNNQQNEKSFSCQLGSADENQSAMGNANERRYEDLCRNIINDMNQYGLSVVDDFLGIEKGLQILNEVHRMYATGVFKDGQLVNNLKKEEELRTIRGDKITWVKGVEEGLSNVGYLINQIDAVICRANTMKNNGKLGNYNIKERTKAMVACYPGSGSHYVVHVDNPNKDGRVITAIYYLNVNWDTERSGGVLRIFPEHGNTVADIEPKFDRLIFFWSDKRNPHEVQPAHRTRYAITVWYFDANEREAALNRCKYENNTKNTKTKSAAATPSPTTAANNTSSTTATMTTTYPNENANNANMNANTKINNTTTTNSANTNLTITNRNSSEICT